MCGFLLIIDPTFRTSEVLHPFKSRLLSTERLSIDRPVQRICLKLLTFVMKNNSRQRCNRLGLEYCFLPKLDCVRISQYYLAGEITSSIKCDWLEIRKYFPLEVPRRN